MFEISFFYVSAPEIRVLSVYNRNADLSISGYRHAVMSRPSYSAVELLVTENWGVAVEISLLSHQEADITCVTE